MTKKVFLDCGTNLGQGLTKIYKDLNMDLSWEIYSFEVNPETYKMMNHNNFPNVKFINKGIWTDDIEKELSVEVWPGFVSKRDGSDNLIKKDEDLPIGGASNIMGDNYVFIHTADNLVHRNLMRVECIDFCKFIRNNFTKDDFIVIKLDIEGSEYPVLEKMINDNTIDYVNVFYIEFHNRMLVSKYNESYIRNCINNRNIVLNNWD